MDPIPDALREYYELGQEAGRLLTGPGLLERARTEEILSRSLPPPPSHVLDVGGGPGTYALGLLERGYAVTLVDPVPHHVEQARRELERRGLARGRAVAGDARSLAEADESVDAVLLLGPLYHLTEAADRQRALREAGRVTRAGGVIVAAAISRFASLLDGYHRGFIEDAAFPPIIERDLRDGQHRNPTGDPRYFTTAYFHHPAELRTELEESGLRPEAVLAVEGPFWTLPDLEEIWRDDERRARLLRCLRTIEMEEALLGASAHLLGVARKRERSAATAAPTST